MGKRKKKEPDPPPGVPAWMATFSDLVTLLLTFFVMLMAMASFDESAELDTALESLREALAQMGFGDGLISMVFGEDVLSDNFRKDDTVRPDEARDRPKQDADVSDAVVRVSRDKTEVRLTLDEQVYFTSGSTSLRPGARARLRDLSLVLADHDVDIRVEGHTDGEGDEMTNWSLSLRRAMVVTDVIHEEAHVPVDRLQARGYGAFRPEVLLDDDQARNRRIDLVVTGSDAETAQALAELRTWRAANE